jgi:hypothetical protein
VFKESKTEVVVNLEERTDYRVREPFLKELATPMALKIA